MGHYSMSNLLEYLSMKIQTREFKSLAASVTAEYIYFEIMASCSHSIMLTKYADGFRVTGRRAAEVNRELKHSRPRRQQKPHKFAYLTMKNSIFARFARAFFIFWHFEVVLVPSATWKDLFCSCLDDVSIWLQMFNCVFLCPKRWFQINSRTVRRKFSNVMTLNNWKMIAEMLSYIFRWRSLFHRRRVCLSSLIQRMKDILLCVHVVVKTLNLEISRCHLEDYVIYMFLNACCTCGTIIFAPLTNQVIVCKHSPY